MSYKLLYINLIFALNIFNQNNLFFLTRHVHNDSSERTLIEGLKNKDILILVYIPAESSNYKFKKEKITLKKNANSIYISYNNTERKMTEKEINIFESFEEKLNKVSKIYKCTISKHYLFYINGKIKKNKLDNSCSEDIFELLKNSLNLGEMNNSK